MKPFIMTVGFLALLMLIWHLPLWLSLWKAKAAGIRLNLLNLVGMKLRHINPKTIVDALVILKRGGVDVIPCYPGESNYSEITISLLETHYLAKGNPILISERYVSERANGKEPDIMSICAEDLKEVYGGEQTDEPAPGGQSS